MNPARPIVTAAPLNRRTRISSDAAWPLRRADGRTWADDKPNAKESGK